MRWANGWRHLRLGVVTVGVALAFAPVGMEGQTGTLHDLPLTPSNVHWGHYDASLAPVLTIRSGDLVRLESLI